MKTYSKTKMVLCTIANIKRNKQPILKSVTGTMVEKIKKYVYVYKHILVLHFGAKTAFLI